MAITNLVKDQRLDDVLGFRWMRLKHVTTFLTMKMIHPRVQSKSVSVSIADPSFRVLLVLDSPSMESFGDTANTASRMESNSAAMKTHCLTASALLLKKQAPKIPLKSRGRVKIKGKEKMTMYWVNGDGDIESGESEDIEGLKTPSQRIRAEKTNTVISSAAAVVVPELEAVTLSELTRRAKTAGMTLADFPNTYGARTLISDDDST